MTTHRPERVADLVREVLAALIRSELRDPRIGFVTLTAVEVSPDLRHAKVFVSRLGEAADLPAALAALNHASAFLRRALAGRVRLRCVPELAFFHDSALERGMRVESLLREIRREHEDGAEAPPDGEADDGGREE